MVVLLPKFFGNNGIDGNAATESIIWYIGNTFDSLSAWKANDSMLTASYKANSNPINPER